MATSAVDKQNGTPWIGTLGPEGPREAGAYGFFVHRPLISHDDAYRCERLEVFHSATQWIPQAEVSASWFFHTVGSGIFLNCTELRLRGEIVVALNRVGAGSPHKHDKGLPRWMHVHNVSMVIYTEADFKDTNPRTEIVVRHRQPGHSEYDDGRAPCLDAAGIDIPLLTGYDGSMPCKCQPKHDLGKVDGKIHYFHSLNCDGTPLDTGPAGGVKPQ